MSAIAFGSDEAAIIAQRNKFLEDVRSLDWNDIGENCVQLYSNGEVFYGEAICKAGGKEWKKRGKKFADSGLATVSAVAALMLFMSNLALKEIKAAAHG